MFSNGSGKSSASSSDNKNEEQLLKKLYSSTDKTTPQTLKRSTQLISIVLILLICISTINLILSISRFYELKSNIETVRQAELRT
jgi:hypothetical protein